MSLNGKIGTMAIPDILQWVGMGKKSGVLSFYNRGTSKNLYFEEGLIISASSNNPRDYLGQFLISAGKITEEDLKRAFITQQETSILLGKILCMIGKLKEEELVAILRRKVEETIYELFLWTEGDFEFREALGGSMRHREFQVRLQLAVPEMIMEGARRYDEWRRIRREFPDLHMVVRPLQQFDPNKYPEGSRKRKLLQLLLSDKTIEELCLELRTDEASLLNILSQLKASNFVEIVPAPQRPGRVPPLDPSLFRGEWREHLKVFLGERRMEEALRYLDELIHLEDQPAEMKKARKKVEHHYLEELQKKLAPLTRVPLLHATPEQIGRLQLSAEEGFVISRINGEWDMETIQRISPLPAWVTLQTLARFVDQGLIQFRTAI